MSKRNEGQFSAFVQAYASGMTIKDFCKLKHLKYDTVRKWACEPGFKRDVAAIQGELYEAFVGHLTGTMEQAAKGMIDLAKNGSPDSVRLAAWRGIVDDMLKVRSVSKLEADIAELKARLDASGGTGNAKVYSAV
jgi:hypothetical protein